MRLLVVEDEIKLAQAIKRALETQTYSVDIASDGLSGYDMASGESYDLIILDLMLPGLDGLSVCQKLRQEGVSTPIMMLTARGEVRDRVTGLDVGADDYLVKPFSFEELFARIRALIRRPSPHRQALISLGPLLLDTAAFKVTVGGRVVNLSTREFSILHYLLQNQNRVVSRDELIAHVWNYDADVLPNVVEVHLKHLRDKLSAAKSPNFIQTIRGRGYLIHHEK
jgi:DNA-binding response OmpR family regulator